MLNLSKYEKHVEVASAPGQCYECGVKWPCDTSLLLAEVRRLREELKVQREMHNVCLEIHTESESCLHAEQQLEALRQSHARLLEASAAVVAGIDQWNESVQEVIGRQSSYSWGGLEELRTAVEGARRVKHGE